MVIVGTALFTIMPGLYLCIVHKKNYGSKKRST